MTGTPALHPAVAGTRVAARRVLADLGRHGSGQDPAPLALVALSGGADSLALAAAVAFEAPRTGVRAGAVVVDHGLQAGSAEVAGRAAEQAVALGLEPVFVRRAEVARSADGPEASAREARYAVLEEARVETGAAILLTAHTRDDQAEQVLLALARGSGTRAIAGIPPERGTIRRPFLGVDRQTTRAACEAQELEFWVDPHNADPAYARVRARDRALPTLEAELGPGVAANLARSAELAREDADALDALALAALSQVLEEETADPDCSSGRPRSPVASTSPGAPAAKSPVVPTPPTAAGAGAQPDPNEVVLSVAGLAALPAAIRQRVIRLAARAGYGSQLSREHTLSVSALVTDWRGQGPIHVPGIAVSRDAGRIVLRPHAR